VPQSPNHIPDATQIEGRGGVSRRGGPLLGAPPSHRGGEFTGQGQSPHNLSAPPLAPTRFRCHAALTPAANPAVLAAAPGDEDAVRCKVVAHIKSDTTDKGLAVIRDAERLPIDLSYYKVTHFDPSALGCLQCVC
jgi:signal recognition particle subunit SRP72